MVLQGLDYFSNLPDLEIGSAVVIFGVPRSEGCLRVVEVSAWVLSTLFHILCQVFDVLRILIVHLISDLLLKVFGHELLDLCGAALHQRALIFLESVTYKGLQLFRVKLKDGESFHGGHGICESLQLLVLQR
jgi:hypothetical protein